MVQFLRNEASNESNKFLNRRMMTIAHHFNEKLYHHWLFKNISKVIDFVMNKTCLKFCRASWAHFYAFGATFLQTKVQCSLLFEWLVSSFENKNKIKQQKQSENLNMYEINKLHRGEGNCSAFSHLLIFIRNLTRDNTLPTRASMPSRVPSPFVDEFPKSDDIKFSSDRRSICRSSMCR